MPSPRAIAATAVLALALGGLTVASGTVMAPPLATPAETRAALARAQADARAAAGRAARLEAQAASAELASDKTAAAAAALAALIQEAEAGTAAAAARLALARQDRQALDSQLAARRAPLVHLTAGLQQLARRPLAVAVLRPGSLRETVHLRAVLETTMPLVRQRTAALRADLARGRALEREAARALALLQAGERTLGERRAALAALESRQRLAARQASGAAAREAERALALAEEARDLDQLVGQLDQAGALRQRLAALPGPLLRPPLPAASRVIAPPAAAPVAVATGVPRLQLPAAGQIVAGFGESADGARSRGLTLAPRAGAQVVSPGSGRVAFAGPFRGFDRIVIVEHAGGYTSLITGLARVDVAVGDALVAGAPLGVANPVRPVIGFELRRAGQPVNPIEFVR